MKKLLTILLVVALALAMVACGEAAEPVTSVNEQGNNQLTVYSFGPMTGGAAWGQFEKGFYDACRELGWEGHYLAPTADNNMSELITLHETAITNGADVMLPLVIDADAMSDMLDTAVEKGITMVAVCQSAPQIKALIGTDANNLGTNVAEALVKCMGDKEIHVVTMQSLLSTTASDLAGGCF